ncbi:MAG: DNA helicase II [Gammaproteobacteria bacterium]|nr:MAG: DNA helicase II [Gammaproteobacteria bacterium]
MDVSPILDHLNEPQRDAVTSDSNRLLVLAGAGSGKTRVLVHRIAWVMATEGVSPYGVLAVTFTNKAAAELRTRIEALTGHSARTMWVGTFHGLAHRLLRTHYQDAGLPKNFQILDSDDQFRLIKRTQTAMGIDETRWPAKQTQWFINNQKDEGLRPEHLEHHGDLQRKALIEIYQVYHETCLRGGMVDFAELLLRSHELWLKNPVLLKHYQDRFDHLLVDEFQDTNSVQYAWLQLLTTERNKITIVGDDDQSIYGWRGAKIENIQQFETKYPKGQVIRLEQNYRSTSNILNAANAVIANNQDRFGKNLWTEAGEGDPLYVYAAFNEMDEARFVADKIECFADENVDRKEVAILYRSNAQSRVLEEALLRNNIPYRIYGGQRFFDRAEIKNALAYLRMISNRNDDTALERIVNVPVRGIGGKTLDLVRNLAREEKISMWQASLSIIERNGLTARASKALQVFIDLINRLDIESQSMELWEQATQVIETSGLIGHHEKEKGEKAKSRIENLQELVSACRQFEADEDAEGTPLTIFLDYAALESGDSQADVYEDSVQLMTLHSAKGLEFKKVFLVGMEEGLFPSKQAQEEPGRLEEERRLCYVGITRSKQNLYLCYAEARRMYGQDKFNPPSRFLREIPSEYMEEVRLNGTVTRPTSFPGGADDLDDSVDGFRLGQKVLHMKFGEGVILNCEGQGPNARIQVNFYRAGSKWLVAQYARLEACD